MCDGFDYKILRTRGELEEFQPAWKSLWREDPNATPFQSPEWLLPWWRQFGQQELRAAVISQHGKAIGLLPFYIYPEPTSSERRILLLGAGTSDYLDGVFAPDCATEPVMKALELICRQGDWDVLYVTQLRPQSILFRAIEQARCFSAACTPPQQLSVEPFQGESCSRMSAVRIPELPSKLRGNIRYYGNRTRRLGKLDLVLAGERDRLLFFDALVRLHSARWLSRGEPGVFADSRVTAWHREALGLLAESGILRLYCLRLNDDILAVLYALADPPGRPDRTQYVYLFAHSLDYSELRPGTLLLGLSNQCAAEEGMETIDMLRGEEQYKNLWHVDRVPTYGFALRRKTDRREPMAA